MLGEVHRVRSGLSTGCMYADAPEQLSVLGSTDRGDAMMVMVMMNRHKLENCRSTKVEPPRPSYREYQSSSLAMWPFTSSSSGSKTVASDLNPPPGPSTQAQPQATPPTPTPTQPAYGRLNIPSGNSPISPQVVDVEQDKLSGDRWTDYKAAFEVR